MAKLTPQSHEEQIWKYVKARALFHRAWNHFNLLVLFGAYPDGGNDADKGIPIRRESDISVPVSRSSPETVVQFILQDLEQAIELFDENIRPIERPSKYSALSLLARVNLYITAYEKAWYYAKLALDRPHQLIDFNTLNLIATYPFPAYGLGNSEVIFNAWIPTVASFAQNRLCVDSTLVALYEDGDCRKTAYLRSLDNNQFTFRGSYVGSILPFAGISLNETYMIAMESAAQINNIEDGLSLYNELRSKRISPITFQ